MPGSHVGVGHGAKVRARGVRYELGGAVGPERERFRGGPGGVRGSGQEGLALLACGVGPGDEVLVQSFTFCASSHPVTYLGATPVFVDSEPETWNMDPALLEEAIRDRIAKTGKRPRAIVPVALYGMPYRIDKIMEIANRYDIPVVEDAAEGSRGLARAMADRYWVLLGVTACCRSTGTR